ncbi:MAG: YceI family protein [Planctomycetota bacterium]
MKLRILLAALLLVTGTVLLADPGSAPPTPESYKIDPVHSTVIFGIRHLNVSTFFGRFNDIEGAYTFDEKSKTLAGVELSIKAASVDTNSDRRDGHIRSAEFLDVEKHPAITFKAGRIKRTGTDLFKVAGDVTLHGVTHPFTGEVRYIGAGKDPWGGYRSGFETSFTIKRSDHEMKGLMGALGDEVRILMGIEGIRVEPKKDGDG